MAVMDQVREFIPNWDVQQIFTYVGWFLILIVSCVATALLLYWWVTRKKWTHKIIIFEVINGIPQITERDTATTVKIESTGDKVLLLNKRKMYLPMPQFRMERNSYAYFIREDGELINFRFENIDKTLRQMGVKLVSADMKYSRASLQKLLKDNYKKSSWLKELIPYIGFGFLIFMIGISVYLVSGQLIEVLAKVAEILKAIEPLIERQEDVLGALENVCSSSGLRSAG